MKKVIFVVIVAVFLNGCFQVLALVGPAATGVASGNIYQSAISYSLSYGVKKSTGKTIIENVIDLNNKSKNRNGKMNRSIFFPHNPGSCGNHLINRIRPVVRNQIDSAR